VLASEGKKEKGCSFLVRTWGAFPRGQGEITFAEAEGGRIFFAEGAGKAYLGVLTLFGGKKHIKRESWSTKKKRSQLGRGKNALRKGAGESFNSKSRENSVARGKMGARQDKGM